MIFAKLVELRLSKPSFYENIEEGDRTDGSQFGSLPVTIFAVLRSFCSCDKLKFETPGFQLMYIFEYLLKGLFLSGQELPYLSKFEYDHSIFLHRELAKN